MKNTLFLLLFSSSLLFSTELHIKANSFNADENTGISIFTGDVNIIKNTDELNASKVTVYTDKQNQPTKFIAIGNVSFFIETQNKATYRGKAQKVVYFPIKKEYQFFKDVHLQQINEKKEIIGDEVVLKTIEGKAYAKGVNKEPVIMIFKLADDNATKEQ
jgi:lipopolysaccharide export system protein LptA